jgi:monoterpene epsilon-lactone hydrolase
MGTWKELLLLAIVVSTPAAAGNSAGAVAVPAVTLPYSMLASEAARAKFASMLASPSTPPPGSSIADQRRYYDAFNRDLAEQMRKQYPVVVRSERIAGVPVDIVTPSAGIKTRNRARVLINLHGGAFMWGAHDGGLIESIPISSAGHIKVVTVDYREGPENTFPAATQDVVAVYAALLKQYPAKSIGIYGCSAGGILAGEVIAWIVTHSLPTPGAAGTFCGSVLDLNGDSAFVATLLTGQPFTNDPLSAKDLPYFEGADFKDPMVFPGVSQAVLAKFPPTLLITGSRDFAMSSVVRSHALLVDAGVEAELHVYEGMWHAFFINPELPESQAAYTVIATFFDHHLAVGGTPLQPRHPRHQ